MSDFSPPIVPPPQGKSCLRMVLVVFGGRALLVVLCAGTIFWLSLVAPGFAAAGEAFTWDEIPLPDFPADRGDPVPTKDDPSVSRYEILLGEQGGNYETPGIGGKLWVYLPAGEHQPQSLPCVLFAPARLDHLVGAALNTLEEDEHALYVKAGCVVVAYELDGRHDAISPEERAYRRQYIAFKNTRGGLVNARNALEYALRKIPEVNPKKIFVAGFAVSASHALLFAAHEPRLAGVMALKPTIDLPKARARSLRRLAESQPDAIDFVTQISPHTHVKRIKCPTFLFFQDEERPLVVPQIAQGKEFANKLKQQATDVTLIIAEDEFGGSAKVGIPPSIEWLTDQIAKR